MGIVAALTGFVGWSAELDDGGATLRRCRSLRSTSTKNKAPPNFVPDFVKRSAGNFIRNNVRCCAHGLRFIT